MSTDITVPAFPESISDGTIIAWHKHPGDAVRRDDVLADIETDKVVLEVPAGADGVLREIVVREGSTVVSGQVIARVEAARARAAEPAKAAPAEVQREPIPQVETEARVAPAARRLIAEHALDPQRIAGSGKGGRILKEDVLRMLEQPAPAPTETKPEPVAPSIVSRQPAPAEAPAFPLGERPEKRVPMTRLRARIAERLVEAQHTAAMLSTFNEINLQAVIELRERYRQQFEKAYEVRLGFMSFFVKACIEALRRFPEINASIDGSDIVYHGFYDVGIAVASPRGLVVPILRDADQMGMAEIEAKIKEFGEKAQRGTLTMEEITGGTFTITNGGVFGSLLSTPILNPPQSAILGMHKIEQRPIVENGEIVARPMMYVALSYDHRLVDGREAVRFLVTLKELLEDPARILLRV